MVRERVQNVTEEGLRPESPGNPQINNGEGEKELTKETKGEKSHRVNHLIQGDTAKI